MANRVINDNHFQFVSWCCRENKGKLWGRFSTDASKSRFRYALKNSVKPSCRGGIPWIEGGAIPDLKKGGRGERYD